MSIWTDLLIMHGYIATANALALMTSRRAPSTAPAPSAGPDRPARTSAPVVEGCRSVYGHPLRIVGQIP